MRGTGDGYLPALDGETVKSCGRGRLRSPAKGDFNSMPPLIHEDLALIGPAGAVSFRSLLQSDDDPRSA